MYKKTINYEDFDGNKVSGDFYFNYTKSELTKMNLSAEGGMSALAEKIAKERDGAKLIELFEKLILGAYGERTNNGLNFIKEDENGRPLWKNFKTTMAYEVLFEELSTDARKFAEFFNAVIPSDTKLTAAQIDEAVSKAEAELK